MRAPVALLLWIAACGDTVTGQPIGGTVDSEARLERFLRRAHLDLAGVAPSDGELSAQAATLRAAGDTPTSRAVVVDDLLARDTFARQWVGELENSIFGGNTLAAQYQLLCGILHGEPACRTCTDPDPCTCSCPAIAPLAGERAQLASSAAELGAGAKSSQLERRYAMAYGYYALVGSPESRVKQLFKDFLARAAEPDEIENGRAMVVGTIIAGDPAGVLFHRDGASYADFIDIVFGDEVYREALVRRVFERYLARDPSPQELAHFVTTVDATAPDVRGLIRAVVSSREYLAQ